MNCSTIFRAKDLDSVDCRVFLWIKKVKSKKKKICPVMSVLGSPRVKAGFSNTEHSFASRRLPMRSSRAVVDATITKAKNGSLEENEGMLSR
jgi:hypothetical protein